MAPVRNKKRGSEESIVSPTKRAKLGITDSPSTPQRSPIKKINTGISLQKKQALIENLQLEITERARRLRAQYHLQAQGLRSRIEIRLNRIPTALRKLKMGDLILKHVDQQQQQHVSPRLPRTFAKDLLSRFSPQKPQPTSRAQHVDRPRKRISNEITGDKENDVENGATLKKRVRGAGTTAIQPAQVLSPTSSNSRIANRERTTSPTKTQIAKPSSPLKASAASRSAVATNLLSTMVEKAKATRGGARKVTTTSNTSSTSSGTTSTTRNKRAAANNMVRAPSSRPGTRMTRRASGNSESSEGSTNTVVRKSTAGKGAATGRRKAVAGAGKKGVSGVGSKPTSTNTAATTTTSSNGRVLRKRG